ncbi:MAG: sensor histidine kinase [Eubacteriales bacterium]
MKLKKQRMSIRQKVFLGMVSISIIAICIVTYFAMQTIYSTMREQIIQTRSMSIGWLKDRLDLSIREYTEQFYSFEVDKTFKTDLQQWSSSGDLGYEPKWRFITSLNSAISMNANFNSIEIYNLVNGQVLAARRSGAVMEDTGSRLEKWDTRDKRLQTNVVFIREGKEILVIHQINRFEDKTALALIVIHMRPYELEGILSDLKASKDETIAVFNDTGELILADYGEDDPPAEAKCLSMGKELAATTGRETVVDGNFWFYRTAGTGKLQVVQAEPNNVIMTAMYQTLVIGILVALFAIMGAVLFAVLFSSIVSKPIVLLSEKMRRVTLNDYDAAGKSSRYDEIGLLEDSFDTMMTRNQELVAQEYQSQIEKRNAQIRALQAQINPHFMYNTLQVIGGMALKKNAPEIYSVTLALSDILRYSLNFSREMVPLKEEIQYLQSFLKIQNERFANRINLKIDIPEDLMDCRIPKLILQPVLENSFEHGLVEKTGEWMIKIGGSITPNGDLLLVVSDNGLGIRPDRLARIREELARGAEKAIGSGLHIGLNNVNSRIRLRNSGGEYGVAIESEEGSGTTVTVLMKIVREDKDV